MNGAHDMGGTMGFGPIAPEKDEPVFHAEWERRMLGITLACAPPGGWNIDTGRHARENRDPRQYLGASYYKIWYLGLVDLLDARELVGKDEIAAGRALRPAKPVPRVLKAGEVAAAMARRVPYTREASAQAAFAAGDRVRTKVIAPEGHTRLPRYARGRSGTIERVHGVHVYPDSNAHGRGEDPQWLYAVSFDARELWGEDAEPGTTMTLDLWEPYLERG